MGQSGNPANRTVSSAADFKKKRGGIFELPSGAVMRLKNPGGLRLFLAEGLIPNSLMSIVQDSLNKGKKMEAQDMVKSDGSVDPTLMDEMMALLDNILIKCAVEPKVYPTPTYEDLRVWNAELPEGETRLETPDELRDDEKVYTDEIDDEDKMFIFQWVTGGTTDLESFRQGFDSNLAALGGSEKVAVPAKRAPRARKG